MMDHLDTECELQGSEGKNESDEKSMYYCNDDGICANTQEMNGKKRFELKQNSCIVGTPFAECSG